MRLPPTPANSAAPPSRAWTLKAENVVSELRRLSQGPNLQLLEVQRWSAEVRAVLLMKTQTLVRVPGQAPTLLGPVVAGFRYHERWLREAPIPWEVMTILDPVHAFHPSIAPSGGLCLGHPPANFSVESVFHLAWAGVVFNMRIVNTIDWQVFRPEAAAYVRANHARFPITRRGLMEPPEAAPSQPAQGQQSSSHERQP